MGAPDLSLHLVGGFQHGTAGPKPQACPLQRPSFAAVGHVEHRRAAAVGESCSRGSTAISDKDETLVEGLERHWEQ